MVAICLSKRTKRVLHNSHTPPQRTAVQWAWVGCFLLACVVFAFVVTPVPQSAWHVWYNVSHPNNIFFSLGDPTIVRKFSKEFWLPEEMKMLLGWLRFYQLCCQSCTTHNLGFIILGFRYLGLGFVNPLNPKPLNPKPLNPKCPTTFHWTVLGQSGIFMRGIVIIRWYLVFSCWVMDGARFTTSVILILMQGNEYTQLVCSQYMWVRTACFHE
jgi:hypothetical protein